MGWAPHVFALSSHLCRYCGVRYTDRTWRENCPGCWCGGKDHTEPCTLPERPLRSNSTAPRCECGSHSVGALPFDAGHSPWCPVAQEQRL